MSFYQSFSGERHVTLDIKSDTLSDHRYPKINHFICESIVYTPWCHDLLFYNYTNDSNNSQFITTSSGSIDLHVGPSRIKTVLLTSIASMSIAICGTYKVLNKYSINK